MSDGLKQTGYRVPQVFVSYARSDKRQVAKLVAVLRHLEIQPWWDDDISPGASWEQAIEKALADADAVIVCWSSASIASENVRSEARVARSRGRLVQVFLESCDPPLFFGERQGIDLSGWNGSIRDSRIGRLKDALKSATAGLPLSVDRTADPLPRGRAWAKASGAAAAVIMMLAITGWFWERVAPARAASKLAVMPIEGLGSGAAVASFADGLTDQITTSLNDGHIPTVSRADSESLKSPDAGQRLKSLGVAYIVSGTIESAGKTLHARLHLDDRVRHASLWSYEARGSADDSPSLNYEIAQNVAGVISCAYRALGPSGLTDTELLSRYLRVCDLFVNHDDATDAQSTFELLNDLRLITSKAPNFAPAHSDLAKFSAYFAPLMSSEQAASARAESERESKRALELDSHSSDAWLAREMALPPTKWAEREALLRKAVAVDPTWPHSNGFLAMFLAETGRMRESAIYAQRAAAADLQLEWRPFGAKLACDGGAAQSMIPDLQQRHSISPSDPDIQWALRWCLLDSGQFREAKALEDPIPPGDISASAFRQAVENALISGKPGDQAKAKQIGAKLDTSDRMLLPLVIQWSAALGDVETAFRLSKEFSPGYPTTGIVNFLFSPQTESMRRDPRFVALAQQYGLAQFWQSTGRWPDFCSGPRRNSCRAAVAKQLTQR